jgi:hypothetical protein
MRTAARLAVWTVAAAALFASGVAADRLVTPPAATPAPAPRLVAVTTPAPAPAPKPECTGEGHWSFCLMRFPGYTIGFYVARDGNVHAATLYPGDDNAFPDW